MINSFEDRVRQYLCDKHGVKFTGKLQYLTDIDDQHSLLWAMHNEDKPDSISGQFLSEDKFFDYVCKEIDERQFFQFKNWKIKFADEKGRL